MKKPLFPGKSEIDELNRIFKVCLWHCQDWFCLLGFNGISTRMPQSLKYIGTANGVCKRNYSFRVNVIEEFFDIGICIVVWLVPICYQCSEVEHWASDDVQENVKNSSDLKNGILWGETHRKLQRSVPECSWKIYNFVSYRVILPCSWSLLVNIDYEPFSHFNITSISSLPLTHVYGLVNCCMVCRSWEHRRRRSGLEWVSCRRWRNVHSQSILTTSCAVASAHCCQTAALTYSTSVFSSAVINWCQVIFEINNKYNINWTRNWLISDLAKTRFSQISHIMSDRIVLHYCLFV